MQLLHPFMPFVTEEVYHLLRERKEGDDLTIKQLIKPKEPDSQILTGGKLLKELISGIRDVRNKNQLKPKDRIKVNIQTLSDSVFQRMHAILQKQVNADAINYVDSPVSNALNVVIGKDKLYIETPNATDFNNQREQLKRDLVYMQGFLISVDKKLSNERFIQNAKAEVIESERKKKADAEEKIKAIREQLEALG